MILAMTLKQKVITGAILVGVFLALVSVSVYLYKQNQSLKAEVERAGKVSNVNFQASLDSLRQVINDQGKTEYEKLSYLYDLQQQTDTQLRESLRKQGYQLAVIQELGLKINDLAIIIKGGSTTIDSTKATYTFPQYDTLMVGVSGTTVIDLKAPVNSFTKLNLKFRPLEGKIKIARNPETLQVMGIFEPKTPGITVTTLNTEVDEKLFAPSASNCIEPGFLDNLKVGGLLGTGTETIKSVSLTGASIAYGLTIQYKAIGAWFLVTDTKWAGISVSVPISSFIK